MKFNNQTEFEFRGFEDPFTRMPNSILDEMNISAKAIGVYAKIIRYQNSKEHKIYIKSLVNTLKDGESAISSAIKELMELGYIERIELRNEKGQRTGYKYIVYAQPIVKPTNKPDSENPGLEKLELENHVYKKKIGLKENKKKENIDVEHSKQSNVINLYRSFKLEKRAMPHTLKLLKQYTEYFSLDVFEYIFIQASEDSISKKYNYIKTLFETLFQEKIFTEKDLIQYNQKFKNSEKNNTNTINCKAITSNINKKNSFRNFDETYVNDDSSVLEDEILQMQLKKFA